MITKNKKIRFKVIGVSFMIETLLYGAVGVFLLIIAAILILKELSESCLGCLGIIFWIIVIIWIFKKCST